MPSERPALPRLAWVDALRGAALVAMAAYHFAWDLFAQGLLSLDVGDDRGWRLFSHIIASTFLGLVGVGMVLAARQGFDWRSYGLRLAKIAAAALGVSAVSYGLGEALDDPSFFVYFGILHVIALGSLLALPFLFLPSVIALATAAASVAAPLYLRSEYFDAPAWWWLGLSTIVQPTVDYVPVLPWIAPLLAGIALGRLILYERADAQATWQPRSWLMRALVLLGRWSLTFYLIHQPLLFGLAALLAQLR